MPAGSVSPSRCCSIPRAHGGRDLLHIFVYDSALVSIHRAHGGPRQILGHAHPIVSVSITRPRGRDDLLRDGQRQNMFQSTRPRGARPLNPQPPKGGRHVSIHAPTGGATRADVQFKGVGAVSIHAPTGGATPHNALRGPGVAGFNPRAHGGRDKARADHPDRHTCFNPRAHGDLDLVSSVKRSVSIHAPTGARPGGHGLMITDGFNPRAHGGAIRSPWAARRTGVAGFNPPPRGRRDSPRAQRPGPDPVSIHAPTGARQTAPVICPPRVSIHAPHRARLIVYRVYPHAMLSIHAHGGRDS